MLEENIGEEQKRSIGKERGPAFAEPTPSGVHLGSTLAINYPGMGNGTCPAYQMLTRDGPFVSRFTIASACPGDLKQVLRLIRELAQFEDLEDAVTCQEADLRRALFGPNPSLYALLAFEGDQAVGFATYYFVLSTFSGRKCLYLEDIYVAESFRGEGLGRQLMAHAAVRAKAEDCVSMRWRVLGWNQRAIRFYESLGANCDDAWRPYTLPDTPLQALAARVSGGGE